MQTYGPQRHGEDGEDDLRLLRSLPTGSVDLVYLDAPFFSSCRLDWIATALEDVHRVLRPTGALFLVCDESVGLYLKVLLEGFSGPKNGESRVGWRRADAEPHHHYVFYFHKSAELGRHGHLYTVVRCQEQDDRSLVAFSFVQGRRVREEDAFDAALLELGADNGAPAPAACP